MSESYSKILKSSSLVGGAQFVRMAIGIVSVKFAAIFIGPVGVGLLGAYQSISQLGIQLAGLGINQSGVREVAVSKGTEDQEAISKTVFILRRMCWLTGLSGAVAMFLLAAPISSLTFGNTKYTFEVSLLSIVILITTITQGQLAVLQGLRQISDLVRVQIIGALGGAICSIILYITLGINGIVFVVLATAIFNLLSSWYVTQKFSIKGALISWRETFSEAKELLRLGIAFMIAGLATTLTAYAARAIIARNIDIEALGIYQAAYAISGYVLNFVLGAMGADFYPRLAGVSNNHAEMTRLVNEQTEIGLLLATPVVVIMLVLAPLIISLLYSAEFSPAITLLRWFILGCFLRVISWPMGFVQMAKGAKYWFIFSQLFFNVIHIIFIFIGISWFGLEGAAIAFFAMYVLHIFAIRFIAGKLIEFSWDKDTKQLIIIQVLFTGITLTITFLSSILFSLLSGSALAIFTGIYCLRQLLVRVDEEGVFLYKSLFKVKKLFGK